MGSCKKKRAFKEENCQTTEDARMVQGQKDDAIMDVNLAILTQSLLTGRGFSRVEANEAASELCGLTMDTSGIFSGILKLNYNGTECHSYKRTGKIVISFMNYPVQKWKHQGCRLRLDFISYKVTRTSDSRSITYNGTGYLTNESGNSWYEMRYLNIPNTVQVYTSDDETMLFGSNSAVFSFNRRMTYSYSGGVTNCVVEGLGSSGDKDNLENWGQSREGFNFTTQVSSPVLWKSSCKGSAPLEGEVIFKEDGKDFEMKCKFGVDIDGNPVSEYSTCPFGWKVSWSYKKKTKTRIMGYE